MGNAQQRAHAALSGLLPALEPWFEAAVFAPYRRPGDLPALSEDDLEELLGLRLGPLVLDLLDADPLLADRAGPAALARLREHRVLEQLRIAAMLEDARRATDLLTAAGIPFAVAKGPGIATHYAHPGSRPYGDVDLLLPDRDFARARALLADDGWGTDPDRREQHVWFERLCREAVNLEHGAFGRVDLHHHVPPWLWGTALRTDDLIGRAVPRTHAGHTFPVLDAVDNFLVCSLHIVSDRSQPGQSLLVWRDIIELGRALGPDPIAARARPLGLLGWIGAVVASLPVDVAPFAVPGDWLDAPIEHPRRVTIMVNDGNPGRPIRRHLARLPVVPNALLYAGGVTFPSQEFLETHVRGSLKLLRWISNRRA